MAANKGHDLLTDAHAAKKVRVAEPPFQDLQADWHEIDWAAYNAESVAQLALAHAFVSLQVGDVYKFVTTNETLNSVEPT